MGNGSSGSTRVDDLPALCQGIEQTHVSVVDTNTIMANEPIPERHVGRHRPLFAKSAAKRPLTIVKELSVPDLSITARVNLGVADNVNVSFDVETGLLNIQVELDLNGFGRHAPQPPNDTMASGEQVTVDYPGETVSTGRQVSWFERQLLPSREAWLELFADVEQANANWTMSLSVKMTGLQQETFFDDFGPAAPQIEDTFMDEIDTVSELRFDEDLLSIPLREQFLDVLFVGNNRDRLTRLDIQSDTISSLQTDFLARVIFESIDAGANRLQPQMISLSLKRLYFDKMSKIGVRVARLMHNYLEVARFEDMVEVDEFLQEIMLAQNYATRPNAALRELHLRQFVQECDDVRNTSVSPGFITWLLRITPGQVGSTFAINLKTFEYRAGFVGPEEFALFLMSPLVATLSELFLEVSDFSTIHANLISEVNPSLFAQLRHLSLWTRAPVYFPSSFIEKEAALKRKIRAWEINLQNNNSRGIMEWLGLTFLPHLEVLEFIGDNRHVTDGVIRALFQQQQQQQQPHGDDIRMLFDLNANEQRLRELRIENVHAELFTDEAVNILFEEGVFDRLERLDLRNIAGITATGIAKLYNIDGLEQPLQRLDVNLGVPIGEIVDRRKLSRLVRKIQRSRLRRTRSRSRSRERN
jgi:hypothetical protein